ncbi:MAG TPA: TIR domain-containing protein [Rhizomicrobium sp.]|jgi:hypothetical protein|nr:TIR domain-containing protein [Rhizomicrobium sp.]
MDAAGRPVFFSYASTDRKVAETICTALEARGFGCWMAARDVKPGENYQISIVHAINAAKVLLLVFSSNTNASDEIKKELSLASKRRLLVIPVRVEDVAPDEGMSYELATRQWVDLFVNWEAAMGQLADQLTRVVEKQPAFAPAANVAPVAAPAPTAARSSMLLAGVAVGVLAALALAYVFFRQPGAPPGSAPQPALPASVQAEVRCMQADADLAITGCSANLADPSVTGATRAGYLRFRGSAYARKFEYKLAITDFSGAIALSPDDGQAYFLRAAVRRAAGDQSGADEDDARAKALGYAISR